MRWFFFLVAIHSVGLAISQDQYNFTSIDSDSHEARFCPSTHGQKLRERIRLDVVSFINSEFGYGACGCGGRGWRRAAYLNMSDPTQTCPPAWELITTPRRSCARLSNASSRSCYSAMFPTQGPCRASGQHSLSFS